MKMKHNSKSMGYKKSLWRLKFIVIQAYQMVTTAMKLKDACSLEEKLWPT